MNNKYLDCKAVQCNPEYKCIQNHLRHFQFVYRLLHFRMDLDHRDLLRQFHKNLH